MNVVNRMKEWRERMRRGRGGFSQVSTWVSVRHSDFLKVVFERLADMTEMGDEYRAAVVQWLQRRRPVRDRYVGTSYSLEIDGPTVGTHWYSRPMGGRVYGAHGTWIELSPKDADEIRDIIRNSVSSSLEHWLGTNKLVGRIIDNTGVAMDVAWVHPDYPAQDDDIISRPQGDDDFIENERRIAREVQLEAHDVAKHPVKHPNIVYYEGFHGSPSRCFLIPMNLGGRLLVGLGHVKGGGTSPTNMFEDLATIVWRSRYNRQKPEEIEWFDIWEDRYGSTKRELRITPVRMAWDRSSRRYSDPTWGNATDIPQEFYLAVLQVYQMDRALKDEAFHKKSNTYKFMLPKTFREICGPFQADIVHDNPPFKFVAHLHAYPEGTSFGGDPCLMISDPNGPEETAPLFTPRDKVAEAAKHIPILKQFLSLPDVYGWNHPSFRKICMEIGIDADAAQAKLTPSQSVRGF